MMPLRTAITNLYVMCNARATESSGPLGFEGQRGGRCRKGREGGLKGQREQATCMVIAQRMRTVRAKALQAQVRTFWILFQ